MPNKLQEKMRIDLIKQAEDSYKKFSSALLPGVENILGVRLPILRKMAKSLAKEDWKSYLKGKHLYFEEVMLEGILIGCIQVEAEERLQYIADFVPKINSWSVCDSFCSSLKFTQKNQALLWDFLKPYWSSTKEYELRFAVIMALDYYLSIDYIQVVLQKMNQIKHEGYYVKMAVAWLISMAYVKFPKEVEVYLQENDLDDFTYNKALQKMVESRRIDEKTKSWLHSIKRKD